MKIDSMDATGLHVQRVQDVNNHMRTVGTNNSYKPKARESSDIRNIPLLQLPEYEKEALPISEKAFIEAIEKANKAVRGAETQFEFSIHEKTKEIMVKVIDINTNEVIREIPPEKILDMVATMLEMAGIIVDERR
ncbi:MAG TPA: flagellar protein FlaG [Acetivibrio sp.]|nr:flagellar protein FlaG [Acetivibrio sp.]HQA58479.1 flagellar protein FlaG [Acetivibrio sp.]